MCLPSMAPTQFGQFHSDQKSLAIAVQLAVEGGFKQIGANTHQRAEQVSLMILPTVVCPIR